MTSFVTVNDVSHVVRRCIVVFYPGKTLQIHVDICDTFQLLVRFPQCNVRKQEEAGEFKCIFVVYSVLESK